MGCGTSIKLSPVISPSESVMAPCNPLPLLETGELPEIVSVLVQTAEEYHNCSDKQKVLSDAIRKAGNQ